MTRTGLKFYAQRRLRRLTACIGGAAWLLIPLPATAQFVEISPGRFTCSAPQGQFVRHDIRRYAEGRRIAGQIRFRATRRDARWSGAGALLFELEGGGVAGAYVNTVADNPDRLGVTIKYRGNPSPTPIVAFVPIGEAVSLTVTLDAAGLLTVTAGGRSRSASIGPVTIVRSAAHCQSGEFDIDLSR